MYAATVIRSTASIAYSAYNALYNPEVDILIAQIRIKSGISETRRSSREFLNEGNSGIRQTRVRNWQSEVCNFIIEYGCSEVKIDKKNLFYIRRFGWRKSLSKSKPRDSPVPGY